MLIGLVVRVCNIVSLFSISMSKAALALHVIAEMIATKAPH